MKKSTCCQQSHILAVKFTKNSVRKSNTFIHSGEEYVQVFSVQIRHQLLAPALTQLSTNRCYLFYHKETVLLVMQVRAGGSMWHSKHKFVPCWMGANHCRISYVKSWWYLFNSLAIQLQNLLKLYKYKHSVERLSGRTQLRMCFSPSSPIWRFFSIV